LKNLKRATTAGYHFDHASFACWLVVPTTFFITMTTKPSGKHTKKQPRVVDHVSDSEDEEIDEDEAFNSEDELKYGAFFTAKTTEPVGHDDKSDDESDEESDEDNGDYQDEEGGDGGQYMLDLLNKLDAPSSSKAHRDATNPSVKESEFAASVLANNLTYDDLMVGLEDLKGFGVLQKTLQKVARSKATAAPVAKVVSDRAQRKVAYQHSSQDVSGWIEVVQQNRQAETLDFRSKARPDILTKSQLIDKFEPVTEFEKELEAALAAAGQKDEKAIEQLEQELLKADELGSNELTLEEYKKRRGQLAKMRALMFYHEQKRHHINKIKSKKYRRIRKKQRERLKESEMSAQMDQDTDVAREMKEKMEMERMQERMTLAHKNTSKWARHVLKRGKNVDMDTRRALSAQLHRGDSLRQTMHSTGHDNDSDSDEDDNLIESARKVLEDAENEASDKIKSTGLFKLSFMQKGIEKQRERAKEEARQLLAELEANERDEDQVNEDEAGETERERKKKKVASSSEMESILESGAMMAKSLDFGNSSGIAVDGGIEIDLGSSASQGEEKQNAVSSTSEHCSTLAVQDNEKQYPRVEITVDDSREGMNKNGGVKVVSTESERKAEKNPWLLAVQDPAGQKSTAGAATKKLMVASGGVSRRGIVDVEAAASIITDDGQRHRQTISITKAGDDEEENKDITTLTQEELVRRAFVAPSEKEVDEDFAKEKAEAEERDDPTMKKEAAPMSALGWGVWAGEGAPPPKPPKNLPKHLQPPKTKLNKRKRQDEKKPHVIINEKRVKKTANNFQILHIPYPFKSREEYERAMSGGLGKEWNISSGVKKMTRPDTITRAGKIIQPISKRAKQKRPPAKF
jgi:U3 small nucleolar RNA-associated protein 14